MKPPLRQGSPNDFQTPPEALAPLYPYLKKEWMIWECAAGQGKLVRELESKGYSVHGSDILDGCDFLSYSPPQFDCIITNPPYSIKQKFLGRCYGLGKPFALLLPLTTFETAKRQDLFKRHGLEVVFFDKRINFHTPSGRGSGSWFATAWFTWGLEIGKEMTWAKLGVAPVECWKLADSGAVQEAWKLQHERKKQ